MHVLVYDTTVSGLFWHPTTIGTPTFFFNFIYPVSNERIIYYFFSLINNKINE